MQLVLRASEESDERGGEQEQEDTGYEQDSREIVERLAAHSESTLVERRGLVSVVTVTQQRAFLVTDVVVRGRMRHGLTGR